MIDIRHLGAVPDDTEKDFAAARIRTQATEALREAQVDLAHVNRIAAVGGWLTAPIASEVARPIAAIVTNAQAARHFLNRRRPTAYRVREIRRFG